MNDFLERLGIAHPIIQAPMAGGATTPELVAAVSESGGLGFIAGAYSSPAQITAFADAVREKTGKPFGINLFAPLPLPGRDEATLHEAIELLAPIHEKLGLPPPSLPEEVQEDFDTQFAAAMETGASVFSFTFGVPAPFYIERAKGQVMLVMGTATTVGEAVILADAGVDAVVAQGSEAGAHRGTFAAPFEDAMIGTMPLVAQVAAKVPVPVVASGGIMSGHGIAAALRLGASAVQMGTAFLATTESGIGPAYRAALLSARAEDTRVTRAFSGRPARGIANRFMRDAESKLGERIPRYPFQNALTRPMRIAAASQGKADYLSLWAGQGVGMLREMEAATLVKVLVEEMEQ